MSGKQRYYENLDALEKDLLEAIKREFIMLSQGVESRFILRHLGSYTSDKYSDSDTDKLEKLEKDIVKLRDKLNISAIDPPLTLLTEFVMRHKAGENSKHISRDIIKRMNWDV